MLAICAGQALKVGPHDSSMFATSQHRVCCGQAGRVESPRASVADWIHGMLKCEFFSSCPRHRDQKKAEATYFCTDCCCRPLCGHCTTQHVGHRLIQIRRYVYCDVVRATDMSPHVDISGIQTYIINQAKVMFLNQRPQSKMSRPGAADACLICSRTLREGCSYCSLACKVEALVASGKLQAPTSGSASDSSECWPSSSSGAAQQHNNGLGSATVLTAHHHDSGSGDSSSSLELVAVLATTAAGAGTAAGSQWQQQRQVGAAAAAWARRHSDSDSEGRSSGYCCRRKQSSPRRSPLL